MMDKENNKLEANNLDSFLDENDLSPIPCPNCGGKVEVTNSRDCELLRTYAKCRNADCDGQYFTIASNAFSGAPKELLQKDSEIVAIKYFYWAQSERAKLGYRCHNEWD